MSDFTKHRREREIYAHDFGDELAAGEQLTGTPTVVVTRANEEGGWEDVTAEFGSPNPVIQDGARSGKTNAQVAFALGVASGVAQNSGDYVVRINTSTGSGRHLVGMVRDRRTGSYRLPSLEVLEEGDPDAP